MKAKLFLALKLGITIGSLYIVARSVIWSDVADLFAKIQVFWILLALGIFLFAQVVSSLRYAYIAGALDGHLDLSTSVRAHFVGLWFNQVLPTSLGGDVVKIAMLKDRLGLNLAFRSAILDRFSGLMYLMAAVAITLPLYTELFRSLPSLVTGLAVLSLTFILAIGLFSWRAGMVSSRPISNTVLYEVIQLLANIWTFRKGRRFWEQFWTSTIVHFNGIAAYGLIGVALGINLDLIEIILIVPLVFLVALFPISFAGWGIRELGAVWLFGIVGVQREIALTMAIGFGLLLVVAALPGLLIFLIRR